MAKEDLSGKKWHQKMGNNNSPGAIYGLGVLGAIVYFLQHANSFGEGLLGILKALVWPAFLVYSLLDFFKM